MILDGEIVVIDGEASLLSLVDGEVTLFNQVIGEGIQVIPYTPYAEYTGTLEVTPSDETQILQTAQTLVEGNIIINPIPSNYGHIGWNGSYLTVY